MVLPHGPCVPQKGVKRKRDTSVGLELWFSVSTNSLQLTKAKTVPDIATVPKNVKLQKLWSGSVLICTVLTEINTLGYRIINGQTQAKL